MTLIHLWFFLDCLDQYRALDIACLERDCLGVNSRCPRTLFMWLVICWDTPTQPAMYFLDLRFFCFMIFWILCILHCNGQLVDYAQDIAFEGGKVYGVCVCAEEPFLHLAFHSPNAILVPLWFFLDSYIQHRVFNIICLERDCFGVHSRCPLTLSMTLVIRAHRGYPNRRILTRSLIFLLHDVLTAINIIEDASVGEIYQRRLVSRRVDCWGMSI